jgi:hypothetical protein
MPRVPCRPSSSERLHRRPELVPPAVLVSLSLLSACASVSPPPPQVVAAAAATRTYSASLRVSVKGPEVRGRSPVLLAFRRPDALRVEIPGPAGARLVAVVRQGRLTAVLPAERAVFEGPATASDLGALLGVPLEPEELMNVLVGQAPSDARRYRARWGDALPRQIDAVLSDGTHLKATVEDADADAALPAAAFDPPPAAGYRPVDADEARRLLGGR